MPRAAKSADALTGHRTKDELTQRKNAEKAAMTGKKMKIAAETKSDPAAHAEWKRIVSLMNKLDKNDDIFSAVMNRYCQLFGEIQACIVQKTEVQRLLKKTEEAFDNVMETYEGDDVVGQMLRITKQINDLLRQQAAIDARIMSKRRMRMDIEKENAMTVAASLRTLPKAAAAPKSENPLLGVLSGDD
ncbi:MAG: P27 family phage terminase small subunit [Clostridia bacterium]|nr:P27 family phage terminase small subunit [Clostridia bacterium]